jgi:hypothetical protein
MVHGRQFEQVRPPLVKDLLHLGEHGQCLWKSKTPVADPIFRKVRLTPKSAIDNHRNSIKQFQFADQQSDCKAAKACEP